MKLVIFAPNWLGDAVMALPAIADVRRAHQDAAISVAARRSVAPLFSLVPSIDETVVLGSQSNGGLRARRFDAALLLPNSFQSAFRALRAGIAERWGYRGDLRSLLLTRAVDRPQHVHQIEYYERLVSALGVPNSHESPSIVVPATAIQAADDVLRACGWNRTAPLVALAPGAAYGGAKRWPPERYAELARALKRDGVAVVLVGSEADAATAHQVEDAAGGGVLNLVGRTDLPTLAGVFHHARIVISNDSGAMHVAAAGGTPVTALFGPTNEQATAPRGVVTILTNPVWCRPCMLRECPIDHACLRGIPAKRVHEVTISQLGIGSPTPQP